MPGIDKRQNEKLDFNFKTNTGTYSDWNMTFTGSRILEWIQVLNAQNREHNINLNHNEADTIFGWDLSFGNLG